MGIFSFIPLLVISPRTCSFCSFVITFLLLVSVIYPFNHLPHDIPVTTPFFFLKGVVIQRPVLFQNCPLTCLKTENILPAQQKKYSIWVICRISGRLTSGRYKQLGEEQQEAKIKMEWDISLVLNSLHTSPQIFSLCSFVGVLN